MYSHLLRGSPRTDAPVVAVFWGPNNSQWGKANMMIIDQACVNDLYTVRTVDGFLLVLYVG